LPWTSSSDEGAKKKTEDSSNASNLKSPRGRGRFPPTLVLQIPRKGRSFFLTIFENPRGAIGKRANQEKKEQRNRKTSTGLDQGRRLEARKKGKKRARRGSQGAQSGPAL